MRIEPYLFFNGRCEEALAFYQTALGANVDFMMRFKDAPEDERGAPEWQDKVMHACLRLGDSQLMASDGMGPQVTPFSGFSLSIGADSVEQAERLFAALAEGGQVSMPLQQTFWAQAFGMLTDRFGVAWMINSEGNG
ncbi:MAG: VOC family protein [Pseudomonas sp.]